MMKQTIITVIIYSVCVHDVYLTKFEFKPYMVIVTFDIVDQYCYMLWNSMLSRLLQVVIRLGQ